MSPAAVLPGDEPGAAWRAAALWLGAALAVLAAYAAAGAMLLNARPLPPPPLAAPTAVMIDLAPVAVAPPAAEDSLGLASTAAPEAPDLPRPPVQDAPTEAPPPPPDLAPDLPPPPVAEATPRLAALPRPQAPAARPDSAPRVAPPPPAPAAAPARAAAKAGTVRPARVAAAPVASRGTADPGALATWQSRLLAHLERAKRYPASARSLHQEGMATVRFRLAPSGAVLSAQIARSSGVAALDEAVVQMMQRASPVPVPPPGAPLTITVPVRFSLR